MKIEDYRLILSEMVMQIDRENLSAFDFGRLRDALVEAMEMVDEVRRARGEVARFRQDYVARISGMEKAIAVVSRGDGRIGKVLEKIEAMKGLSAEELLECYSQTQARYRDAFPASFGGLQSPAASRKKNILNEYR